MSMSTDNIETKIEVALEQLVRVREDIKELNTKIDNNYVTRIEFEPVRNLVYGMVSLVLTVVVGGLLVLVIRK